ncbi:MAG: hypothetical protein P8M05_07980 [Flavobacteriales bacterium]|nr:hypothetical protein [Flavobacteriales bacterium]
MNWTDLFENINKNLDLEDLKDIVIANGEYKDLNEIDPKENLEISFIKDGIPNGTIYYGGGKELFMILFKSDTISLNKARLLNFIESEILKSKLIKTIGEKIQFFNYEFMINMHLSADIASGQGYFRKSLLELESKLKNGPLYLNNENAINSISELNKTLKDHIYGFRGSIEDYKQST